MLKYFYIYIVIFNLIIPLILSSPNINHQKNPRHSLKSSLIAEHSRKTHKDFRIQSDGESNSIENILQTVETFAQRSHRRAFEDAAGQNSQRLPLPLPPLIDVSSSDSASTSTSAADTSILMDEDETLNSLDDKKNPFLVPNFDENYKTHSICEEWNSGQQGNNVNLEWTESADRLLRIIGNGVVKNGYNMFMAPGASQRVPTNVSVAVYIESMSSFRAQTMDYEVDMYLAMGWYDRRLAHNCTNPILVTHKFIADRIWQPDLYFVNSKFAYLQEVTTPNFMLIVYPDGLIFKSMRIDVTLSCMMDLKRFPMDKQECPMVIQSYAYVENLVNLTWHIDPPTFPIGSNTEIKLNDMQITNTRFEKCSGPYPMFRGYGNWSCVRGFIVMKRLVMFHVIQTYIPTGMLVFISWMSFWLDPRASPARITLTITTLLTLTTMSNGARQDLPQVAYIKMLDLWLSFNQGLIFMVLLEYSIVSYFLTRRKLDCEHRKPAISYSPSLCSHLHKSASKEDLRPQRFRPHTTTDSPLIGFSSCAVHNNGINNGGGGGTTAVPVPTTNGTTYLRQRHFSMDNGHGKVSAQNSNFSMNHGIGACVNSAAALMAATQNTNFASNKFDWTKPCSKCAYENEVVARKIDQKSRILFPSAFGIFCFAYWFYYGYWVGD